MNESSRNLPLKPSDWRAILDGLGSELSVKEKSIVELLAEGKTQVEIGKRIGLSRSTVWRKATAIAERRSDAL